MFVCKDRKLLQIHTVQLLPIWVKTLPVWVKIRTGQTEKQIRSTSGYCFLTFVHRTADL